MNIHILLELLELVVYPGLTTNLLYDEKDYKWLAR
jgi:hypothetical protein